MWFLDVDELGVRRVQKDEFKGQGVGVLFIVFVGFLQLVDNGWVGQGCGVFEGFFGGDVLE